MVGFDGDHRALCATSPAGTRYSTGDVRPLVRGFESRGMKSEQGYSVSIGMCGKKERGRGRDPGNEGKASSCIRNK